MSSAQEQRNSTCATRGFALCCPSAGPFMYIGYRPYSRSRFNAKIPASTRKGPLLLWILSIRHQMSIDRNAACVYLSALTLYFKCMQNCYQHSPQRPDKTHTTTGSGAVTRDMFMKMQPTSPRCKKKVNNCFLLGHKKGESLRHQHE
jgi:hypothetical protein